MISPVRLDSQGRKLMLEKTIEEIIKRHVDEVWPDLNLRFVESQRRLPKGKILDICFEDENQDYWIVELKRFRVTSSTIDQLSGYLEELKKLEPHSNFKCIAAAPHISEKAMDAASRNGFLCRELDEKLLIAIAERHGLPVDHESGHRPARNSTNRTKSRPTVRSNRPPTPQVVIDHLRTLDATFPPGTLDHRKSYEDLYRYWSTACPSSPESNREIATQLSLAILKMVPTTAISNRSQSKTDPYTTIKSLDGRVAAAVDSRKKSVKLDFPLPIDMARESVSVGEVRIWKPRGYSMWVQSSVGAKLSLERALDLLKEGLAFEFKEQFRRYGSAT